MGVLHVGMVMGVVVGEDGWEGRVAVDEVLGYFLYFILLITFVIFCIVIAGNKKAPNMEITKQPRSWYSGLCNRWLSLVGVSIHF